MKILLDAGAKVKNDQFGCGNTMEAAIAAGFMKAIRLLVEHEAALQRPDGQLWTKGPQKFAVEHNHLEALQYLVAVEGRVDVLALSAACRGGKVDLVAYLLLAIRETTPNPLERDCCPLYFASLHGHTDISRRLIEHGTNVNQVFGYGTPLSAAATHRHMEIIRLLLDNGADPNQQYRVNKPFGNTATYHSSTHRCRARPYGPPSAPKLTSGTVRVAAGRREHGSTSSCGSKSSGSVTTTGSLSANIFLTPSLPFPLSRKR
jgi:ankyrin repeat protein